MGREFVRKGGFPPLLCKPAVAGSHDGRAGTDPGRRTAAAVLIVAALIPASCPVVSAGQCPRTRRLWRSR